MCCKIIKILTAKKGTLVINLSVFLLIFTMVLSFAISFLPAFDKKATIYSMAHEIARYAEIKGEIDGSVEDEFNRLKQASGITNATIEWDADYIGGSKKLQLGSPFTVTVRSTVTYGIGSLSVITRPVVGRATGRSEKYWK
ncbi:MAG TPA: hypothetical protein DCP97_02210 [Ruminococcaceae bacterium]|jgi:hypothetical protein|nr:hypothetical protein [Oscillospiraceae bacterium]